MYYQIFMSKTSVVLLKRIQSILNEKNFLSYNLSGTVKKSIELCDQERKKKPIEWESVSEHIKNIELTAEEQNFSSKSTTFNISQKNIEIINAIKDEISLVYGTRTYPSTAMCLILAAAYLILIGSEDEITALMSKSELRSSFFVNHTEEEIREYEEEYLLNIAD